MIFMWIVYLPLSKTGKQHIFVAKNILHHVTWKMTICRCAHLYTITWHSPCSMYIYIGHIHNNFIISYIERVFLHTLTKFPVVVFFWSITCIGQNWNHVAKTLHTVIKTCLVYVDKTVDFFSFFIAFTRKALDDHIFQNLSTLFTFTLRHLQNTICSTLLTHSFQNC